MPRANTDWNSHVAGGYCNGDCGSWNNCPGNGQSPPPNPPACYNFGGANAVQMPQLTGCTGGAVAPFATYTMAYLSGYYNLWVR